MSKKFCGLQRNEKKKKSSSTRVYTLPLAGIFVETTPNRTYFQKQFVRERDSYDDGGQAHLGRVHDVLLRHPEVGHHGRIVRRVDFEQPVVQHHGLFGVLVVIVLVDVVRSGYGRVHQFYADLKNHTTLSLQKTAGWPLFRRRRFIFCFSSRYARVFFSRFPLLGHGFVFKLSCDGEELILRR